MKPWAEDNYLERLMPELRQANRVRMEPCPDSELLAAFTEDQLTPFVRGSITAHLAQCRECSEICARLVSFSRAAVPAHDPEWVNAEKRLDNWKDSFLQSKAAANRPKTDGESVHLVPIKGASKTSFFGRFQWAALSAVAAIVIVGGAVAVKKGVFVSANAPVPVAGNTTPTLPAAQTDGGVSKSDPDPSVLAPGAASQSGPELTAKTTLPKTSANPDQPKTPGQPHPHHSTLTPDFKKGDKPKKEEKKDDKEIKAENENLEMAHDFNPPTLNPNDRILTGSGASAAPSSASMAPASLGARNTAISNVRSSPSTSTNAASASTHKAANVPAAVQLDAGSRLWIQVGSINKQTDGSFTFRGSLLQPSDSKGAQSLEKGTELAGSGTNKDGKVTLAVSGFSIQGVPFTLPAKITSGVSLPGTGKAVPFKNGQVFEMWVSSASTYEKAAAGTSIEPRH